MEDRTGSPESGAPRRVGRILGSFILAYAFGVFLLVSLFWAFGVWDVLAGTRLLDLLIRVGIVKYHDQNLGWVEGVADHKFYLTSQTPVDWWLVALAALMFLAFFAAKSFQFDAVARHFGSAGSPGSHGRAYLYGLGLDRWFPFGLGAEGTRSVLLGQGGDESTVRPALFAAHLLVLFEIVLFATIGLLGEGWGPWVGQMAWGAFVFGLLFFWVRRPPRASTRALFREWSRRVRTALVALTRDPPVFAKLGLLSVVAFALEDVAAYVLANAFGIGVEFPVILMGLAVGYMARLVPLSPGGIGQFEWGFAGALVLGGVGAPEAATLAVLDNLLRYAVGSLVLGSVVLWYGVETDLRTVLQRFATRAGVAADG